jgi:hypothetical protein
MSSDKAEGINPFGLITASLIKNFARASFNALQRIGCCINCGRLTGRVSTGKGESFEVKGSRTRE